MVPAALRKVAYWAEKARQSMYRVDALEKHIHVSRRQLQRYTQELFGQSPQQWLDEERLKIAASLLNEQSSVKSVASDLGFKQVSHFSRKFKSFYGFSPGVFLSSRPMPDRLQ